MAKSVSSVLIAKRREIFAIRKDLDMLNGIKDMDTIKYLAIVDIELTQVINNLGIAIDLEKMK